MQCKPLVSTIGEKTIELSKAWEQYFDLVQLVKLDCGRSESIYFYWKWQLDGADEPNPNSWTAIKKFLEEKKARLDKCKPKWDDFVENKLLGNDKCKEVVTEAATGEFTTNYDASKANKDA